MQSYRSTTAVNVQEDIIMRLITMTWAVLHIGLVSAATYLLISTDVLTDASIFLIH